MEPFSNKIEAITVGGQVGAGKSQLITFLREQLGYQVLSVGKFFRDEAIHREMEFHELQELMKTDNSIDLAIDARQKEYLLHNIKYIIDSRLGAIFAPKAFNVFLAVDPKVGAQRVWDDLQKNPNRSVEMSATCVEDVFEHNQHRMESERMRYQQLYNVADHHSWEHYTLYLKTTNISEEEVANRVLNAYKGWTYDLMKVAKVIA